MRAGSALPRTLGFPKRGQKKFWRQKLPLRLLVSYIHQFLRRIFTMAKAAQLNGKKRKG